MKPCFSRRLRLVKKRLRVSRNNHSFVLLKVLVHLYLCEASFTTHVEAAEEVDMKGLERATNIATLIACVALVEHIVVSQYTTYARRPAALYKAGETISDTAELGLKRSSLTLLLGTASTCHFCTESMGFYDRLTKTARAKGVRVVGVTLESTQENRLYLQSHELQVDAVVSAQDNRINITGTPTLILVRDDGSIVGAWRGRLDSKQEEDVIQAVAARKRIAVADSHIGERRS